MTVWSVDCSLELILFTAQTGPLPAVESYFYRTSRCLYVKCVVFLFSAQLLIHFTTWGALLTWQETISALQTTLYHSQKHQQVQASDIKVWQWNKCMWQNVKLEASNAKLLFVPHESTSSRLYKIKCVCAWVCEGGVLPELCKLEHVKYLTVFITHHMI